MKKFGKFASEVYRMIRVNPDMTAGELFNMYKINYPNTIRSRNEVAKRVSELKEEGVVRASGRRPCKFTGCDANTWKVAAFVSNDVQFSTEPAEEQRIQPKEVHAWDEDDSYEGNGGDDDGGRGCCDCGCECSSRQQTAQKVAEAAGERCVAMDKEDEVFLREFRKTLAELKSNPLFSRLAPAKMKTDAEKLEKALRYF